MSSGCRFSVCFLSSFLPKVLSQFSSNSFWETLDVLGLGRQHSVNALPNVYFISKPHYGGCDVSQNQAGNKCDNKRNNRNKNYFVGCRHIGSFGVFFSNALQALSALSSVKTLETPGRAPDRSHSSCNRARARQAMALRWYCRSCAGLERDPASMR